ncbi:MAG TPA: NAD-dependent succinate-semialdehyde dehydrogenase [Beutenbergiaceae bacterium]|nr:NAD-dependent succinate-semialdehyde dehydrogenase [Beutenbergiaceae bacterium]
MTTTQAPTAPMLIDGRWVGSATTRPVHNPADGTVVGHLAWGGASEAVAAADAAREALPHWGSRPARERADVLLQAVTVLTRRHQEIAALLARETGKRLPEAVGELTLSMEYLRWFAEEARRPAGEVLTSEVSGREQLVLREPAGVVASLSPWNFPCSIQARKLAPALAAGCTVVARVSEKAPLAVTEMIRCLTEAGIPDGVINLVHGPPQEISDALLEHPSTAIVTFTGSTAVGRTIMAKAAERVVHPLLELGGNGAFIVFDDADVEAAVEGALVAKFRNNGQSCVAANRFFVQAGVYEEFTEKLAQKVQAMSIGDPMSEPLPDLGPVIDDDRRVAVEAMVQEALDAGANLLNGTRAAVPAGPYVAPALLTDVPADCAIATEEIFGPVAGVFRFDSEDEVIERANATEMGLASFVFTVDASRCWRMARRLQVGILGINDPVPAAAYAPMGGVKQSGLGREGSRLGLEEFQSVRYLAWRQSS